MARTGWQRVGESLAKGWHRVSGVAPANQTKERSVHELFAGAFRKRKNTRIHTKMGEIHELFVLALSLVWFAGATPESWRRVGKGLAGFLVPSQVFNSRNAHLESREEGFTNPLLTARFPVLLLLELLPDRVTELCP